MNNGRRYNLEQPLTSCKLEKLLSNEIKRSERIIPIAQPFNARSLFVPKSNNTAERTITMTDWAQPDKVVLYKAIIASYNYVFCDKEAPISSKEAFARAASFFIEWLNVIRVKNRYEILKHYETDRMNELNNHGGNSPLHLLMTILNYAIDSTGFREEVSANDYDFIRELRKTKVSPNLNKSQKTLASYFGALDWLRRDDIGIGTELYSALASPKLTINSLSLTSATVILELNNYKSELRALIQELCPRLSKWMEVEPKSFTKSKKQEYMGNILYYTVSAYHKNTSSSNISLGTLEALALSIAASEKSYFLLLKTLASQDSCDALLLKKVYSKQRFNNDFFRAHITANNKGCLFSFEILYSLLRGETKFVSGVENMMFGWLMASLTVQPYDIQKLTPKSFRKIQIGGRDTQIECEYFKGRSRVFHTTRALSAKEVEGQALLTYLSVMPSGRKLYTPADQNIRRGIRSITGSVRLLLNCESMIAAIRISHKNKNIPLLIPSAYCALIKNGSHPENITENPKKETIQARIKLVSKSESPCRNGLFGLQAIKNSAVHAFSDPYTYHYLVNRNSHTNQTEKLSYLTEDNEAWINNAGRITREVMFDLIQNVFTLDFENNESVKVKAFNCEFMTVTENISSKCEEMNSRLRFVTGQAQGRVNEVGILAFSNSIDGEQLSPIYVLDNPLSAFKMLNYIHEFKKHYKKLLSSNPRFLFETVMPTVEWIEVTLGKLDKKSQQVGREQFTKMVNSGVVMSVFHSL